MTGELLVEATELASKDRFSLEEDAFKAQMEINTADRPVRTLGT